MAIQNAFNLNAQHVPKRQQIVSYLGSAKSGKPFSKRFPRVGADVMDIVVLWRLKKMNLVRRLHRESKLGRRFLPWDLDGVNVKVAKQAQHALSIELQIKKNAKWN